MFFFSNLFTDNETRKMARGVILVLVLVFASDAVGSPLAKPPPSKLKPRQTSTPAATILIEVTVRGIHLAPSFWSTATQAPAQSRNQSNQKSQKLSTHKLLNLSSQNSTRPFSDNSTSQLGQNHTKASSEKSEKQPTILKPYQIYWKNLPANVLSKLPNYGKGLGFAQH
ncbi:F8U6 [Hyposoter didymator ichnovirus]|nr:F8U2 [Hyposoter didymator ichnovirus]AIK25743.1 F8U6 [Hyposoter didymator ichnovirus]